MRFQIKLGRVFENSIIILVVMLFISSCGYFSSGTWEDDPDNWKRAFNSKKPDDVIVLHSWYWRSPHWTYEFRYYFEIQSDEELKEQLFIQNRLKKLEGKEVVFAKKECYTDCPEWFAPKAVDKYEVWVFENQPERHFLIFIDKKTGNLFMTDYQ